MIGSQKYGDAKLRNVACLLGLGVVGVDERERLERENWIEEKKEKKKKKKNKFPNERTNKPTGEKRRERKQNRNFKQTDKKERKKALSDEEDGRREDRPLRSSWEKGSNTKEKINKNIFY